MIRVTIWNEYLAEKENENAAKVYPAGIHEVIKSFLKKMGNAEVKCVHLCDENQGLSEELLMDTDVLIWWSHYVNEALTDENAELVTKHVNRGMGFIALHSAHLCKPLIKLLGTSNTLQWKEDDSEILYVTCPSHPIAKGIPSSFKLENEELYGEYFDIPKPDDVIFTGWFKGGCVFRSAVTFTRGQGRIFYFQPGHEEYPIYYDENIQKIIVNAVEWVCPDSREHS